MKTNFHLVALATVSLLTSACIITIDDAGASFNGWGFTRLSHGSGPKHKGSGLLAEEKRQTEGFSSVTLEGSLDISVEVGPETSVIVRGDDNLLKFVRTEVHAGELVVGLESGSYNMKETLAVHLTTPHLSAIDLEGSGDIEVAGVNANDLRVQLSGSGDIRVRGEVEKLKAGLSGSGDLSLAGLRAQYASVHLSGSGGIRTHAVETLDAVLSGSGEIGYRGHPTVKAQVDGSGSIYSID